MDYYRENSAYWSRNGEPLLLLGGSDEDNPFQWPGDRLTHHLDAMVSCGANYIRNVLSDRDEDNVPAFAQQPDGRFDLTAWNEPFWERLEFFLRETADRGIVVQLTLWDQYDIRGRGVEMQSSHPWHPARNVNYPDATSLREWPNFFRTVENGEERVLGFQRGFVLRVLESSRAYDHVLYNVCNENFISVAWDEYWAQFIQSNSGDRRVHVTAMQMDAEATVRLRLGRPDLFSYVDISQNNQDALGTSGREHYATAMRLRNLVSATGPVPLNNVKIYGSGVGAPEAGSDIEAARRFWRNIFAGSAAVRFHRPEWGMGLSPYSEAMIASARRMVERFDVFRAAPLNDVIEEISGTEAYCMATPGERYAVYFPCGGAVVLDPLVYAGAVDVEWLDVETSTWSVVQELPVAWSAHAGMLRSQRIAARVLISCPTSDIYTYRNQWIAVVTPK